MLFERAVLDHYLEEFSMYLPWCFSCQWLFCRRDGAFKYSLSFYPWGQQQDKWPFCVNVLREFSSSSGWNYSTQPKRRKRNPGCFSPQGMERTKEKECDFTNNYAPSKSNSQLIMRERYNLLQHKYEELRKNKAWHDMEPYRLSIQFVFSIWTIF